MKPKYWAITILAAVAICAGVFYYLNQPALDLGPVVAHHSVKTIITPPPAASSSPTNISGTLSPSAVEGWKTYTNSQYGFSLKFPSDWKIDFLDDVNEPTVNLESGSGEIMSFYPKGRSGYDLDPTSTFTEKQIIIDGGTATETTYSDDFGKPYLISVIFQAPLKSYPNFEIQLTSKNTISDSVPNIFDHILSTFKFTN